jgi:hypothetical protein
MRTLVSIAVVGIAASLACLAVAQAIDRPAVGVRPDSTGTRPLGAHALAAAEAGGLKGPPSVVHAGDTSPVNGGGKQAGEENQG